MLADPQVITVNAVAKSMPRILLDGTHAFYQMADQSFSLDIRHTNRREKNKSPRVKSLVIFTQRKVVADPLTAVNDFDSGILSIQIDRPDFGFSSVEFQQMATGLFTWCGSTMVDNLFGRQF
jgi:hypothetical protein